MDERQPATRTEIGDLFKKLHPKVDARTALSPYLKEQDGTSRLAQRFRGKSYAIYKAKLNADGTLDTDELTKRKLVVVTLKVEEPKVEEPKVGEQKVAAKLVLDMPEVESEADDTMEVAAEPASS